MVNIKKVIIILFILGNINKLSYSQWIWQNPYPHVTSSLSLCFINENTGWWFGDLSTNYYTTNTGINWNIFSLPGNPNIICSKYFQFEPANKTIWAGGYSGAIYYSTNSGTAWNQCQFINTDVKNIFFFNQNTGYIAASNWGLYKTTDRGQNWSIKYSSQYAPTCCYFINDNLGWVAGYYYYYDTYTGPHYVTRICRTTNAGNDWNQIYYYDYFSSIYFGVQNILFKDSLEGIIWDNENKKMQKTTNGGFNWNFISNDGFYNVIRSNLIYKTGNNKLQKSTDFGNSWIIKDSIGVSGFTQNYINSYDTSLIFIESSNGYIHKTTNEGANWFDCVQYVTMDNIRFLYAKDSLTIYSFTNTGKGLKTINGGSTWYFLDSNYLSLCKPLCMSFTNSNTGWMGCKSGKILKSSNTGTNWNLISTPSSKSINFIKVYDDGIGYFLDTSYALYKTTDNGITWFILSSYSPNFIRTVSSNILFKIDNTNYAHFYKSTNGGLNWVDLYWFGSFYYGLNLCMLNENYGFAFLAQRYSTTGYYYYCHKTTNGGLNWENLNGYPGASEISSFLVDSNILYSINANNNLTMTSNGGINWTVYPRLTTNQLRAITTYKKNIWIAGDNGVIIKGDGVVPVSINKIDLNIPIEFMISQNYPNPFNSSTKIIYQISKLTNVKLIIYDVTGKEIMNLVNERQNPGSYEVTFDGSEFASGIYFYRIQAGDYTSVKRMVLIK